MTMINLKTAVLNALTAGKAHNISALAVDKITNITDHMIIATGTSTTHVKSLANRILKEIAGLNLSPLGVEGEAAAEWILIDLGDVVVHVMQPGTRAFYNLEKLWATFDDEESLSA